MSSTNHGYAATRKGVGVVDLGKGEGEKATRGGKETTKIGRDPVSEALQLKGRGDRHKAERAPEEDRRKRSSQTVRIEPNAAISHSATISPINVVMPESHDVDKIERRNNREGAETSAVVPESDRKRAESHRKRRLVDLRPLPPSPQRSLARSELDAMPDTGPSEERQDLPTRAVSGEIGKASSVRFAGAGMGHGNAGELIGFGGVDASMPRARNDEATEGREEERGDSDNPAGGIVSVRSAICLCAIQY
eukprot:1149402-Rhodomonas_salina.2